MAAERERHTDGSLVVGRVTAGPAASKDSHGGLGVLSLGGIRGEFADILAVDVEGRLVRSPVHGVFMELLVVVWRRMELDPVVGSGISLAEEVALDLVGVAAEELPVNLVQAVRQQHGGGDDALARGGLDLPLDVSEHDVEVRGQLGGVEPLADGQAGAVFAVRGRAAGGMEARALTGEPKVGRARQCRVGGTF